MIASRKFRIIYNQKERDFEIRIFPPAGAGRLWMCAYEIDWPEGMKRAEATGVDAVQALEAALKAVGGELYSSPYHEKRAIIFDGEWYGYGFPVPAEIRGKLIGDDAKYF